VHHNFEHTGFADDEGKVKYAGKFPSDLTRIETRSTAQKQKTTGLLLKQHKSVSRTWYINTLRTGDADLRFYVATVQNG